MRMFSHFETEIPPVTGSGGVAILETQKLHALAAAPRLHGPGWNPKGISAQQFRDQRWLDRERARVAARTAAQLRAKARTTKLPNV